VRRSVLAAAVAALLAASASPALAVRRPAPTQASIGDRTGDWAVASQDIVSAQVSSGRVNGVPTVRAVLTLADVPDGVAQYAVSFASGCDSWVLSTRNLGGGDMQDVRLQHSTCQTVAEYATYTPENAPAQVAVSGKQVVLTARYAVGLEKGLRVSSIAASASPFFTGASTDLNSGEDGWVTSGDLALANVRFELA